MATSASALNDVFVERHPASQTAFALLMCAMPLRCVVSVDKTHKDGADCCRTHERSLRSSPCVFLDRDPRKVPQKSTMTSRCPKAWSGPRQIASLEVCPRPGTNGVCFCRVCPTCCSSMPNSLTFAVCAATG